MRFTKMHGCGNDYVYVDGWEQDLPGDPAELARAVSDRHRGIGADGLILVAPDAQAAARMRMWNADGSESEMCGNGLRCAAALLRNRGRVSDDAFVVATGAGLLECRCLRGPAGICERVEVAMGRPRLTPEAVPVAIAAEGPLLEVAITLRDGTSLAFIAVGMGNPHAVCFVADLAAVPLEEWGPQVETHALFPRRSNVEFVEVLAARAEPPVLRQRTWERGSGVTQACGTGACAVAVAAMLQGRVALGEVEVRLDGGPLLVRWDGTGQVHQTGEAIEVFTGTWPLF